MTLRDLIKSAAAPYLGGDWKYPESKDVDDRVAYPWPAGIKGPAVAKANVEKRIRCSTLTASLLMRVYPSAPWTIEAYAAFGVWDVNLRDGWDTDNADSPIDAAVRMGIGERVEAFEWSRWFLIQGWRRLPGHKDGASGHAFIGYDRGNGILDVFESTSKESFRGPRWRSTTPKALRDDFPAALYLARLVERP